MNLYAYVRGDPVNLADPSGLDPLAPPPPDPNEEDGPITVKAREYCNGAWMAVGGSWVCTSPLDVLYYLQALQQYGVGYHSFLIVTYLVPETQCTGEQARNTANQHRFPGQDPRIPLGPEPTHVSVSTTFLGIAFGGPVITFSPEPGVYVNQTEPGHMFHSQMGGGTVTRTHTTDQGWHTMTTRGEGTNFNGALGAVNQLLGPDIFVDVDEELQDALESSCGG